MELDDLATDGWSWTSNAKQLTRRIGPFRVEVTSAGWWIDFRGAVVSALLVSDSSLRNGFIYGSQEYIGRMAEQKEMALLALRTLLAETLAAI